MTQDSRRLVVAFAFAIGIHEVVAGLVPNGNAVRQPEREIVEHVRITRIVARPSPSPTPVPAPRAHAVAPLQVAGRAAHREIEHLVAAFRPKPPKLEHVKPVWDIPVGAQGAGAGRRSGAGSPGNGVAGNGAGSAGNGEAATNASAPCGAVDFEKLAMQSETGGGAAWVDVRMIVHFPDGRVETAPLDYPFYYPSERVNPFVNDAAPMLMQYPPAGKRGGEPQLVQYVMSHSTQAGYTLLPECPGSSAKE